MRYGMEMCSQCSEPVNEESPSLGSRIFCSSRCLQAYLKEGPPDEEEEDDPESEGSFRGVSNRSHPDSAMDFWKSYWTWTPRGTTRSKANPRRPSRVSTRTAPGPAMTHAHVGVSLGSSSSRWPTDRTSSSTSRSLSPHLARKPSWSKTQAPWWACRTNRSGRLCAPLM
jgi:hypothetical protein